MKLSFSFLSQPTHLLCVRSHRRRFSGRCYAISVSRTAAGAETTLHVKLWLSFLSIFRLFFYPPSIEIIVYYVMDHLSVDGGDAEEINAASSPHQPLVGLERRWYNSPITSEIKIKKKKRATPTSIWRSWTQSCSRDSLLFFSYPTCV